MKNIFAFNTAETSDDRLSPDGELFITNTLSAANQAEIDALQNEASDHPKKMRIPVIFIILKIICYIAGMGILGGFIKADVPFFEAVKKLPIVFIICIASLAMGILIQVIENTKKKKYLKSDEFASFTQKADAAAKRAKFILGIPDDASETDVLCFEYRIIKDKAVTANAYEFVPLEMYTYADNEKLYISDCSMVFTININDITEITRINRKTMLEYWNKEDSIHSKKYKKYRMSMNKHGAVALKYYYSIRISNYDGDYEILVPPYEIDRFTKLTKLNITE